MLPSLGLRPAGTASWPAGGVAWPRASVGVGGQGRCQRPTSLDASRRGRGGLGSSGPGAAAAGVWRAPASGALGCETRRERGEGIREKGIFGGEESLGSFVGQTKTTSELDRGGARELSMGPIFFSIRQIDGILGFSDRRFNAKYEYL